jgi:DNA-3-methyladenine glycosylase II
MPATRFTLHPRGPYSLAASARFLEGFAPAAHEAAPEGHLHLAFPGPLDEPAGVCLRQEDDGGAMLGEIFGSADPDFVRIEAQRILSLDHDGAGFAAVGERDPVVGRLQERFPGLRPVLFLSPYEAAAWALIGHRIRIVQAAGVKARMAAELGDAVDIHGDVRHAFPPPRRLADLEAFPGLFGRKAGVAALAGRGSGRGRAGRRPPALPRARARAGRAAEARRHRPLLGRADPAARRGRGRPPSRRGASPAPCRRACLRRRGRAHHCRGVPARRVLAALPNLGRGPAALGPGGRDARDRRTLALRVPAPAGAGKRARRG